MLQNWHCQYCYCSYFCCYYQGTFNTAPTMTAALSAVGFIVVMNSFVIAMADLPWVAPPATATVRTTVSACSCCYCYYCPLLSAITIRMACECMWVCVQNLEGRTQSVHGGYRWTDCEIISMFLLCFAKYALKVSAIRTCCLCSSLEIEKK